VPGIIDHILLCGQAVFRSANMLRASFPHERLQHCQTLISVPLMDKSFHKIIPNPTPEDMMNRFRDLATIVWHLITPSMLTYEGVNMPVVSGGVLAQ